MAEADTSLRVEALERRVASLEERFKELHPTVEEHDDRLDEHDKAIGTLGVRLADVKFQLERMAAEQHRLAEAVTAQNASLELILRNTASIAAAMGVSK